ncbi:MAG TPA: hypothetical protein VFH80_07010, partial [Solirubrobacteraceae bacterium]|nr:hypothetical protein [Solirubrobacteraceae bacterium]
MRGQQAATRRGHGPGGWLRRAARWGFGLGLLALVLTLLGGPARTGHANAALTAPSLTVPSTPATPSVTTPSVPVPVPTVPVPTVPVPTVPVPTVPVPTVSTPTLPTPTAPAPSLPTPSVPTPSVSTPPTAPVPSTSGAGVSKPLGSAGSRPAASSETSSVPSGTGVGSSKGAPGYGGSPSASGYATADAAHRQAGGRAPRARRHPNRQQSLQQKLVALVSQLRGCLASIPARQKRLLILRTGVGGGQAHSPRQVARILHVSARRESRIEQAAVTRLRKADARTSCANVSQQTFAIAGLVASRSLEIIGSIVRPGPSAPTAGTAGGGTAAPADTPSRSGGRSKPGATSSPRPSAPAPAPAPAKSGVISAPENSGVDWLLLAAAIVLLLLAAAVVIARRRSQLASGTPAAAAAAGVAGTGVARRAPLRAPHVKLPRPRRGPRLARLSALVGGLAALPLIARRRDGEDTAAEQPGVEATPVAPIAERRPAPTNGGPAAPSPSAPDPTIAAARAEEAASAFALAAVLEKRGEPAEAEDRYRSADTLGHPEAA